MRRWRLCLCMLAALGPAAACQEREPTCGHVCSYDAGDPKMAAARARARATVGVLLEELEHPSPERIYVSAQVRVSEGTPGEHIWLDEVRYERGELAGTLSEDATGLPRFRKGLAMRVRPGEVLDWMVVEADSVCGAFSLRVDWARMDQAEKDGLLQAFGFDALPPAEQVCAASRAAER